MKIKLDSKKTAILALTLILIGVSIATALVVWQLTTRVTVTEPFQVESNIPATLTLAPGDQVNYYIKVKNTGSLPYKATLQYAVTGDDCVDITPETGTSQTVQPGETVTFNIIISAKSAGTASINWKIDRSTP